MTKLLLKYMAWLVVLVFVMGIILYVIANKLWKDSLTETMDIAHLGISRSLEAQLIHHPPKNWPAIVKKLQPTQSNTITVLPLAEVSLPKNQMQQLQNGKSITIMTDIVYYFGHGVSEPSTYRRIGKSDYALKIDGISVQSIAPMISGWMTHLITLELQQTPLDKWREKIKKLEKDYNFPLTVLSISDPSIPEKTMHSVVENNILLGDPNNQGNIEIVYVNLPSHNKILKIGPISYPMYPQYSQIILIGFFIILVMVFLMISTILFSRNLKIIYKITEKYSHGDFSSPLPFSKHSTLHMLYNNIVQMGNKIKNLIDTQRNLTRFVAHDCRTPISTMLFAIQKLENEELSDHAKIHIHSLKEDLADLNTLTSDFLNYARFSEKDLTIQPQLTDVNQWVQACIDKYKSAPKETIFLSEIEEHGAIYFDPKLMKHVLLNLLDNALKHADTKIKISQRLDAGKWIIQVEDDGKPIDDSDKDRIFQPFVTLDDHSSGFGLGLHIAEIIVKKHQGDLAVSDSSLGGACFTIVLPTMHEPYTKLIQ